MSEVGQSPPAAIKVLLGGSEALGKEGISAPGQAPVNVMGGELNNKKATDGDTGHLGARNSRKRWAHESAHDPQSTHKSVHDGAHSCSLSLFSQGRKRNPNPNFLIRISLGGVGVLKEWRPKSSVCPSKPRETKLFRAISRDFFRDIPELPKRFEKERFVLNFCLVFSAPQALMTKRPTEVSVEVSTKVAPQVVRFDMFSVHMLCFLPKCCPVFFVSRQNPKAGRRRGRACCGNLQHVPTPTL